MTFDVTIDDANDLVINDYLAQTKSSLPKVAQESTIEFIEDINYLSAKSKMLKEEYKKNPGDVWSHAELMRYYGWA